MNIMAGSFPEADGEHVYNTAYVFDRNDGTLQKSTERYTYLAIPGKSALLLAGINCRASFARMMAHMG
jgi:hypothetical protein